MNVGTFNALLPPVAVLLWVLMYAIYLWREPGVRRWLDRLWSPLGRRRDEGRPDTLSPPVVLFRRAPPAPPRPAMAIGGAPVPAPQRIAEWRVEKLPLRYRLLGRVRAAANDN